jgi:hypothetical protein
LQAISSIGRRAGTWAKVTTPAGGTRLIRAVVRWADHACSSSSNALLSVKATHAERLTSRRRAARSTRAVAEMMWRRSGTEVNFPIAVALLAGAQGGFLQ